MINFMLPGLTEHLKLNLDYLKIRQKKPECFLENNINAVYGNFQFCSWDGGRVFLPHEYTQHTKEDIEFIMYKYNVEYKVPMRFVFTNNQLTKEDCYDRFCNIILKLCENDMNEIVVSSPILEDYLTANYPGYKLISSTTKCLVKEEDSLEEIKNSKYFLTCLDYNLNKNWKYLNSIPQEYRDKVEILINAICPPGCQERKEHYRLNSLSNLTYGKRFNVDSCRLKENTLFPNLNKRNNLSLEEINDLYYPKGFKYFKLEGRTLSDAENALNYVKYTVKPEYQLFIAELLLNNRKGNLNEFRK